MAPGEDAGGVVDELTGAGDVDAVEDEGAVVGEGGAVEGEGGGEVDGAGGEVLCSGRRWRGGERAAGEG